MYIYRFRVKDNSQLKYNYQWCFKIGAIFTAIHSSKTYWTSDTFWYENWTRWNVTWNLVQSEDFKWHLINYYLKWGELILIQSKDRINFDPVLLLDQYTSPGMQYYHVSKIKQRGWLIYSWIINAILCVVISTRHFNMSTTIKFFIIS
jgi:hypothetical protein